MADSSTGAVVSTFTTDAEGWTIQGDVQSSGWQATGGDPGGNLQWVDAATGADSYWVAGAQFLGNDTAFYGGKFFYDNEDTGSDYNNQEDVELIGDGMTLVAAVGQAGTDWTHHKVTLSTAGGWRIGDSSGALATGAQIKAVLGSLTQLLIRAEFVDGNESGGLDNVIMTTSTAAAAKVWLDGSDNWATAADWSGGSVPTTGSRVLVSEGDPKITANVALTGSFTAASTATVTLAGGYLNLKGTAALAGTVNGTSKLYVYGTAIVDALTIGGKVQLANYGTVTQSGGVALGDTSGDTTSIYNTVNATYAIAGDTGITLGAAPNAAISNAGLFEKTGGTSQSVIDPRIVNSGTISVQSGTLDFEGAVSGTGAMTIGSGATLQFGSTVGAGQTISFSGSADTLALGTATAPHFSATVENFGAGESIDLLGLASTGATLGYTPNGTDTGGRLKVINGASRAYVTLDGSFVRSSFHLASDGNGGTTVTYA